MRALWLQKGALSTFLPPSIMLVGLQELSGRTPAFCVACVLFRVYSVLPSVESMCGPPFATRTSALATCASTRLAVASTAAGPACRLRGHGRLGGGPGLPHGDRRGARGEPGGRAALVLVAVCMTCIPLLIPDGPQTVFLS